MSTNNAPPKRSRDILHAGDLIGSLRRGQLPNDLMDAHIAMVEACEETGGKGSITLKIGYSIKKSHNGHMITMKADVSSKKPKLAVDDVFNLHPDQLLSEGSVDQQELPVNTVQPEPARDGVSVADEPDNSNVTTITGNKE